MPSRSLTKVGARWKQQYANSDQQKRLATAYQISCEANGLCGQHDEAQIIQELANIVQNDHTMPRKLLRLSQCFNKSDIAKAQKHGSRGASLAHLLMLTRVEDRQARKQLLNQSIRGSWSTEMLRQHTRGRSRQAVSARPTQLVSSVVRVTDELLGLLEEIAGTFPDGLEKVKQKDRQRARERAREACKRITKLKSKLDQAEDRLRLAEEELR